MEAVVVGIESVLGVYLGVGALLLYPLHRYAVPRIDASADGASWGFCLVVSPGLIALWPVILHKWSLARRGENSHGSPDRPVSSRGVRRLQSVLVKLLAIALPLIFAAALYYRDAPVASTKNLARPAEAAADVR